MWGRAPREPALSEAEGSSRAQLGSLNPPLPSGKLSLLSRTPAFLFPTTNLRAIAAVSVQLKAVFGRAPQYMVFYYLTRPHIRR